MLGCNTRNDLTVCKQMSSDLCKGFTDKLFGYTHTHIHTHTFSPSLSLSHTHTHTHPHTHTLKYIYIYKDDLALNNLQLLICHKTKPLT